MILFTVGTEQYPFNSLMNWIDTLITYELIDGEEEIVVQYGSSIPKLPKRVRCFKSLPESEFKTLVKHARVLVSHCGEGSVMLAQSLGTPLIVVPRTARFGEHVDDHQLDMARALEMQGVPVARSPGELARFLASPRRSNKIHHREEKLCNLLSQYYDDDQYKKVMVVCSSGGHFKYAQSLQPFLKTCQDVCWVTFKTATTEVELQQHGQRSYWAHSPTNRHLPNLVRNMGLAFKVLKQEKPDLVLSTGAGVGVPFLWAARFVSGSTTAFIESKTRLSNLSLSARMLYHSATVDKLIVRFKELADLYPGVEYIPTEVVATVENLASNTVGANQFNHLTKLRDRNSERFSQTAALEAPIPQDAISRVNNTVFLIAPPALGCRELNVVLKFLPLSQEGIKRIVIDSKNGCTTKSLSGNRFMS